MHVLMTVTVALATSLSFGKPHLPPPWRCGSWPAHRVRRRRCACRASPEPHTASPHAVSEHKEHNTGMKHLQYMYSNMQCALDTMVMKGVSMPHPLV